MKSSVNKVHGEQNTLSSDGSQELRPIYVTMSPDSTMPTEVVGFIRKWFNGEMRRPSPRKE